jgi:hypothetical protein
VNVTLVFLADVSLAAFSFAAVSLAAFSFETFSFTHPGISLGHHQQPEYPTANPNK